MKSQVDQFLQVTLGTKKINLLVAVIGICKNAGKTTLLNWLLQKVENTPLGVITTGRDGEDVDLVTNESKPKIHLPANVFFSTFAEEIERHSPHLEVMEKLLYRAGGRNLWLARTTQALQVEIVGPATAESQVELANHILSLGAKQVFIDGSFDRKAISLQEQIDALILVISPAMGKEKEILSEINRLYSLSEIRMAHSKWKSPYICYRTEKGKWKQTEYKSLLSQEKEILQSLSDIEGLHTLYIPCTISDRGFPILKSFLQHFDGVLMIRHPNLLHISHANLDWILENTNIQTIHPFRLKAIAVNSYAFNNHHVHSDKLRSTIRNCVKKLPIIDVKEIIE